MEANTVIVKAADGEVQEYPLDLLLERNAVIANKVNGDDIGLSMGGVNQLWIPGLPAKYFLRDIVSIDFEKRDIPPAMPDFVEDGRDYANRPNVSIKANYTYRIGETVDFQGYADDFDRRIVAVELSLDDGATWTTHETQHAQVGSWVYWHFGWKAQEAGTYKMLARAVNERGDVSPIPAAHVFHVL